MGAETKRRRFSSPPPQRRPAPGSTLVTIRAGAGSSRPLFCVHAEAGDVSLYYGIAAHLPGHRPLLGLCAPPPGELAPGARLEQIAERHVREIRATQPDGPYLVLGECTGGALAYEIAQQLHAGGARVALLALVDAFAPGLPRLRRPMPRPLYRIVHRSRILAFHGSNLLRLEPRAKLEYAAARARRAHARVRARAQGALRRTADASAQGRALRAALAAYDPQPYAHPMVLFRATTLPLGIESSPDLGWGSLVESLQIETVPGYFTTPISEPRVGILAERLARHLAHATGNA